MEANKGGKRGLREQAEYGKGFSQSRSWFLQPVENVSHDGICVASSHKDLYGTGQKALPREIKTVKSTLVSHRTDSTSHLPNTHSKSV